MLTQFRPELLNRLDEIIVFSPLKIEHIEMLVKIQLKKLVARLEDMNTFLKITDDARKFLAYNGYDPEFGARPLKRVIQRELEDVLAFKMLDGTIKPGDHIEVRANNKQISFHRIKPETSN